jgi:hypothetical protein
MLTPFLKAYIRWGGSTAPRTLGSQPILAHGPVGEIAGWGVATLRMGDTG